MTSVLSIRDWFDPFTEIGTMSEEHVSAAYQPVHRPAGLREGFRMESDTRRDDALYEKGWFADFRARWRADLERERLTFRARMEAL